MTHGVSWVNQQGALASRDMMTATGGHKLWTLACQVVTNVWCHVWLSSTKKRDQKSQPWPKIKNTVSFHHHSHPSLTACSDCFVSVSPCLSSHRCPGHQPCLPSPAGPCTTPPSCLCTWLQTLQTIIARTVITSQVSDIFLPACCFRASPSWAASWRLIFSSVHPIIPAELFYSDPSMSRGRRIPNIVSDLRVSDPARIQACVHQQPGDKSHTHFHTLECFRDYRCLF